MPVAREQAYWNNQGLHLSILPELVSTCKLVWCCSQDYPLAFFENVWGYRNRLQQKYFIESIATPLTEKTMIKINYPRDDLSMHSVEN
jgi:hypothetical protein